MLTRWPEEQFLDIPRAGGVMNKKNVFFCATLAFLAHELEWQKVKLGNNRQYFLSRTIIYDELT